MTTEKLRVGVIGVGLFAIAVHVPMLRSTGRAEVVAVARRRPDRLAMIQKEMNIAEGYTDWREMLDKRKLDAVVIATPHNLHVEPALAALDCGLHVLLEKPAADTIEGAHALVKAARKSDRMFTVAENMRGEGRFRTIKRALDAGAIGALRQINMLFRSDFRNNMSFDDLTGPLRAWLTSSPILETLGRDFFVPDAWRKNPAQMGGDSFTDNGVHLVDLLLWLGGAPAQHVSAFRVDTDEKQSAILSVTAQLANGVLLSITFNDKVSAGESSWNSPCAITAYGSDGAMEVKWGEMNMAEAGAARVMAKGGEEAIEFKDESIVPATAFVASILDGAPNFCTIEDGAHAVALVQSAYRAAETKQVVTVPALP
jgi:predicted dehydrogenase